MNIVERGLQKIGYWRLGRYVRARNVKTESPYPIAIYRDLIREIQVSKTFNIPPFTDNHRMENRIPIYVRHDIDTLACLERTAAFMRLDRELGIRSGFYFRADQKEYDIDAAPDYLKEIDLSAFDVGLHTACYLQDDYLREFQRETDAFTKAFGFIPKSFSVHGLGEVRLKERLNFNEEVSGRLAEFGFEFSDCHPSLRSYTYVIEDCHRSMKTGARFIYDDFFRPPTGLPPQPRLLILTHPCYWNFLT